MEKEYQIKEPVEKKNRQFALDVTSPLPKFFLRLGGETDFNFNSRKRHAPLMKRILEQIEEEQIRVDYLEKLEKCTKLHHDITNFSLMQSVGKLQQCKGRYNDRFDTFLYHLSEYYQGRQDVVLRGATAQNCNYLQGFLDKYQSVYHYCEVFYFIKDVEFVNDCIINGEKSFYDTVNNVETVKKYISLAEKYWEMKYKIYQTAKENMGESVECTLQ